MKNIKLFDKRTLQDFSAFIDMSLSENITDPLEMKRIIEEYVDMHETVPATPIPKPGKSLCPECKRVLKYCSVTNIFECRCGYSSIGK